MMHTWSIAGVVQRVWDGLAVVERVTRPPRLGHDWDDCIAVSPDGYYGYDEPDLRGADWLADKEAEEEVAEPAECPTGFYAGEDEWYCTGCNGFFSSQAEFAKHRYEDEVPNPTEPSLSDDELVGVRGLLQERYGRESTGCVCPSGLIGSSVACPIHGGFNTYHSAPQGQAVESGQDMGLSWAAETFPQYTKTSTGDPCSGSVEHPAGGLTHSPTGVPPAGPDISLPWQICDLTEHYTTLGGQFERPWGITDSWGRVIARIESRAHAEAVVAAVNTDPSRGNRLASVRGEGGAPDSGIQSSPGAPQPQLDWHGWAEPAVMEVLSEHRVINNKVIDGATYCCDADGAIHAEFGTTWEWAEHVAPILASRLACDPARAIAALHNHKPQ